MKLKIIEKLEVFIIIFTAVVLMLTCYKIGEINGKIAGIDRAVEIMEE